MIIDHVYFTSAARIPGWVVQLGGVFDFEVALFRLLLLFLLTACFCYEFAPFALLSQLGSSWALREFDLPLLPSCVELVSPSLRILCFFVEVETHHDTFLEVIVKSKLFKLLQGDVGGTILLLPLCLHNFNHFLLCEFVIVVLSRFQL